MERVTTLGHDGWSPVPTERDGGDRDEPAHGRAIGHRTAPRARWIALDDSEDLLAAARRHGLDDATITFLEHHGPGSRWTGGRHTTRARVERAPGGALLLVVPTLAYVDVGHDVLTGSLACLVTDHVVLTAESGPGRVTDLAFERLTHGPPVPDDGPRQVLAAVVLALVARATDVEVALGEAVAEAERTLFGPEHPADPLQLIYGLKREIAEARRALGPVTSVVPELVAEAEDARSRRTVHPWLPRVQAAVDRVDHHLDTHDSLLADLLEVHLAQVSVRQNEDMRKISAWAAMIAVPTLVAGVYGMNFRHMPELTWPVGYPLAVGGMAVACLVLYGLFKRSGWL
ncbi:magnesium and cobalt transport protein CorA [Cellulomonas soli]|uniref:magnesium and cobalt transport protein CorA n=1 Tax=Cellulomonas soli TaxID=931535 RepID=UPI003F86AA5C